LYSTGTFLLAKGLKFEICLLAFIIKICFYLHIIIIY
jgi:hypothetical protein